MNYTDYLVIITVFLTAAGIGICGLCILQIGSAHFDKKQKNFFRVFFGLILTYQFMYLIRYTIETFAYSNPDAGLVILKTATFIEFLVTGILPFIMSLLLLDKLKKEKLAKPVFILLIILLVVHVVMLVISQFTDLYYGFETYQKPMMIDGSEVMTDRIMYRRSPHYFLSNVPQILMLVLNSAILVIYRKKLDKRMRLAFWVYIIAPVVAAVIQLFYADIKFIIIATVAATVNMFTIIQKIQNEEFEKQQNEKSRLDTELTMATRIQADMLPNIFPAFPERKDFDVHASMQPAKEVGGDFYDFFLIDEDHLALVMADVSGKGVPAALFMMISKIIVQNYTMFNKDVKSALEASNAQICKNNREEMFVTVWLGILDLKTGVLTAANAGHEYPVLKPAEGSFELIKNKHGIAIGGKEDAEYKEREIKLEKGAKLFLYTDGVVEATNAEMELFGPDRMLEALRTVEDKAPKEILEAVEQAVNDFVKDAPQFDDLTMLCLQYNGQ